MEGMWVDCKRCESLAGGPKESSGGLCRLCGTLHCDECLNDAGYCTPCSERMGYLKEDAIPV